MMQGTTRISKYVQEKKGWLGETKEECWMEARGSCSRLSIEVDDGRVRCEGVPLRPLSWVVVRSSLLLPYYGSQSLA